ncbi:unnamed protein product [marine sediment metagenome]|uniref:ARG and Rhodanese-Phosphatase-superfamily-associated domain-containing protein n=1 Tax=marine sediment metagenome TaxID=412755 RepID=X0S5A4_9ZZZZ
MSKTVDLLLDIASEQNGYRIGEPWRFHELSLAAIVPIIRENGHQREYLLLAEAKGVKIKDTGSIDKIQVTNKSGQAVLAKAGEYVAGGTQTRVLTVSQVIFSEEKVILPCACVHSTKGIRADQPVEVAGYAPREVRGVVYSGIRRRSGSNLYTTNFQQDVWGSVKRASRRYAESNQCFASSLGGLSSGGGELGAIAEDMATPYFTPTEDLAGRVRETGEKLEKVLKKVPHVENQVGICLCSLDGLDTFESFEHPDSWKALRDNLLKAEADKLVDLSNSSCLFEFRADKARDVIRDLLTSKFDENVVIDRENSQTIILNTERFQGEVVTLRGEPIHASFMRKQN